MNAKAAAGALSVFLGHENRPEGTGACVCPPGTLYGECACEWGQMVSDLIDMGYGAGSADDVMVRGMPALWRRSQRVILAARAAAMLRLCRRWAGTQTALAAHLGLSLKGTRDINPTAVAELSARRGYNSSWVNRKH